MATLARVTPTPLLLTAVALVSAAAIGYEIALMRILSIVHWHHFAWMVISLALLGYGASGTAIALARERLESRFRVAFALGALLFSLSMPTCLVLAQMLPFNALEIVWDPRQFLYLAGLYLLFMLPFGFAAICVGLALTRCRRAASRLYFCDLLGAGLGAALVIALLFLLRPERTVLVLAVLALAASVLAAGRPRSILVAAQLAVLACLLYALSADRIGLRLSEFKGLSQALEVSGTRVLAERSSPLGLLTVVESPRIPFRYAPGLSYTASALPPEQLALFTDGDAISVIDRYRGDIGEVAYLGDVTAALPYHLLRQPRVLVLGAGGGTDVLAALYHGAARVDAVELNPQVAALVQEEFGAFAGKVYGDPRVRLHLAEARGFVARSREQYDLVQLALSDSPAVAGSGVQALSESYVYTVEAMQQYFTRLAPGGLLAVSRWLKVPPRDSLKLAAIAIEALRRTGVAEPGRQLAVIRSWNTVTLLVKNGVFGDDETERIREFARQRSFDVAWYPGMQAAEANRFNRLERPWFHEGIAALLGPTGQSFTARYKFDIRAATDGRPFFFDFFRWRALPEVLALREGGGAGLLEWGYLLLAATLAQAVLAGGVLVLLPLALVRARHPVQGGGALAAYFLLLGLAFLFVEMACIQKFMLFLSHPLYAVAVVLAGFLVFAGLGSLSSTKLSRRLGGRAAVAMAAGAIALIVVLYLWLLPLMFREFIGQGDAVRVLVSFALIAPLAFCMGMPFPLGLDWVGEYRPRFLPWAWGLNGFASVVGAVLATLLAVHWGFDAVLMLAVLCYGLATLVFARMKVTQ